LVLVVVIIVHTFLAALVVVAFPAAFFTVPFLAALAIVSFLAAFLIVPFLAALVTVPFLAPFLIILVLNRHTVVVLGIEFGKYGKL
jgi:hypothetical protein